MTKQIITPHLWYDTQAKEAAEFYVSVFGRNSQLKDLATLHDTPSDSAEVVSFAIWGYDFMAISAGPKFKFNPSISFMVNFDPSQDEDARQRIDQVWARLSEGGQVLMPLGSYPFSEHYGWLEDKYGLSWQLIYTNPEGDERPLIIPSLMFVGDQCGRAKEATDFYLSVFKDAKRGAIARYPAGMAPEEEGTIMFTDFKLEGQWFAAMDSAQQHNFAFNEAVSLMVNCQDQQEIDYYWDRLSAVPEAEQCGWVKDKYGVSWQIAPENMGQLIARNPEKTTPAMLAMKKIIIADLEKAGRQDESGD
ncbi:MAG: VOC family protein [Chloroflexota bacterium]|jgi:predicted 3-demethylubiquinone-9 3-methyltransferase (glyoxalase superfamily)